MVERVGSPDGDGAERRIVRPVEKGGKGSGYAYPSVPGRLPSRYPLARGGLIGRLGVFLP